MSLLDDGNGDRDVAEFGVVLEAFAEIFGLHVSHLQLKISINKLWKLLLRKKQIGYKLQVYFMSLTKFKISICLNLIGKTTRNSKDKKPT